MNDYSSERMVRSRAPQQGGPPLWLLGGITLGLLACGVALLAALGGIPPLPYEDPAAVLDYFRAHSAAAQVSAVFVFASSVPLTIYAATASARLRQLGVTAPGATIALAGGVLAAGGLGLSGLLLWTLSRPEVNAGGALVNALYYLTFLTGGVAHVVMLGLLTAGLAVPALILRLLPRALAWTGLGIAVAAELTTAVLIWPPIAPLLPVARFAALIWLVVVGVMLPERRARQNETFGGPA
ncbi:hypothetical protein OS122_14030 [Mycolicibacterium mucogenicum]|uniref:hypothetical protein n=1 Tax=Mycolicibacterium mucogenicum TaxID=56689 RepID=UPI00226ABEAB|nr:hypothetical protein [Mycolicibacterium mucogenicum]MCX8562008.1 hypothetical protein [Mycolicibacterium mucogenicum]